MYKYSLKFCVFYLLQITILDSLTCVLRAQISFSLYIYITVNHFANINVQL